MSDLSALLRQFIDQATEGTALTVKHYPREQDGLRVAVSFGKGSPARVPWIAFFAPGQDAASSCYPLVLYYRSIDLLVVAYGHGEYFSGESLWRDVKDVQTIDDYFRAQFGARAERYGQSLLAEAFHPSRQLNLEQVSISIAGVIGMFKERIPSVASRVAPTLKRRKHRHQY